MKGNITIGWQEKNCNSKLTDMRQEVPHYSRRYFSLGERFCMLSKCQNYLFLIIDAWTIRYRRPLLFGRISLS